jgi:LPXTG-site transpeptidase (sortase) family protein
MANLPNGTTELYELLGGLVHPSQATAASADGATFPVPSPVIPQVLPEVTSKAETASRLAIGKFIREVWVYGLVFVLALVFYFAVITNSFAGFANTVSQWFPGSAKTVQQQTKQVQVAAVVPVKLTAAQQSAYSAWIQTYFYDVSDASILDPNNDISGNGLTNYQKFLLGLNPRVQTSMSGMDMTDSQALIVGINPLTGGPLTDQQKQIIAANIDLEEVSNKLTLEAMQHSAPQVAGAATTSGSVGDVRAATPTTVSAPAGSTAPLRGDTTVDQTVHGELDIPSLNITVPIIWTQNANDFEKDLPNGVVHYPGTAMPGDIGTSYISGHSSNYAWIKGSYNKVFATLNDLKQYDSFTIKVTDTAGKTIVYHYVVDSKAIFTATDQQQFASTGKSTVALSTCWPVGTSQNRLVVFGELTQVEQ